MVELYNTVLNYYKVLSETGYLPIKVTKNILVLDFLKGLMDDPDFLLIATCEEQALACNLYKCLMQNNCLII